MGYTVLLCEITEDEAGPVDQMAGWLCRQAGIDSGWQPHKSGASPGGVPV
jgi:hypothetical protein